MMLLLERFRHTITVLHETAVSLRLTFDNPLDPLVAMPEPPEIYAFNERMQRTNKCLNYPECKCPSSSLDRTIYSRKSVHLQIFPHIWPASSYKTCQVNREAYAEAPAATEEETLLLHNLDVQRAEGQPYEHLLRTRLHGRLHCAPKAKQLVVACGQVRLDPSVLKLTLICPSML